VTAVTGKFRSSYLLFFLYRSGVLHTFVYVLYSESADLQAKHEAIVSCVATEFQSAADENNRSLSEDLSAKFFASRWSTE